VRYRDARHIDLTGYHGRRPVLGAAFRFGAYGLIAAAVVLVAREEVVGLRWLLLAAVTWWCLAWYLAVGAAFRAAAVAAVLLPMTFLTLHRCGVLG
jgi:hypothetical protein